MSLVRRPRRLRQSAAFRELVAETSVQPADLILPMFIMDGIDKPQEITSMPGVYQHTLDSLKRAAHEALDAGVKCVDLFGVPREEDKDATGSVAWDPEGILNRGIAELRQEFGDDLIVMADTCLDEFTSHGHCGMLDESGRVLNDKTVSLYQDMARSQARAGVHMVSPSGMMDGQIAAIREALDEAGHEDVAIMAYSAKYASAFFGPFRDAVGSSLEGDRRTYQQDPRNFRESLLEIDLDIEEGADFVMVKPGLPYLDVLAAAAERSSVPVAVYQVSGEYAMIKAAAQNGWIDGEAVMLESLTAFKRAGADQILTYFATDAARLLK
ncbi:delta-aminolevulinic acid dehydratase [Corynebacterium sp. HMSC06D04]|uniref:Delta-aminolevulinic acid dehydratase n=1 Tax=Corynebacterium simulans TaxID=146827 RepID=A0ABR5VFD2_9CORY|nr:delta-aminolevulinic acid dehydratase family protein [Corynebacterium simulans]OFL98316.1 delta-aminolevulinic acid dehydratase [Corynebacterium sp. HMSC071F07]OFQ46803.1 delta-aminolevulinic acid dehydratase [Corynebacterium sp. HMSC076D02]OFR40574.1 delta-aminolevulinic acid dehydratase [Corynebacterium sp. HMSC077D03]OFT52530.1 delta-aminolevulinic acid dehydratase [Corynebacterium sp. HMSC06D04]OHO67784.1 delta-aminolevulinic acid dehydratase [Corynebacterium sp. HMSC036D03]